MCIFVYNGSKYELCHPSSQWTIVPEVSRLTSPQRNKCHLTAVITSSLRLPLCRSSYTGLSLETGSPPTLCRRAWEGPDYQLSRQC